MNDYTNYNSLLSAAITWLRFPLIFLIIMLHCYSVVRMEGTGDIYFNTVYPFALWLGETGVPGFFCISGYLFFLSRKSYGQKLKTRIHTLLIPYLLWNFSLLIMYVVFYAIGHPQNINGRNMAEYNVFDYIRLFWDRGTYENGNFSPLLCPFWYIRNLFIMSLISPLLYYIIRYARELFLLIAAIWWMTAYHNAFIQQTILFFSFGAYFAIHDVNPLKMISENKKWFIACFILLAITDISTHTFISTGINLQIHRLALIFNIPALFLLADICVKKEYYNDMLPNAAFIVFAVHYPIVVVLRKLCASKFATASDGVHIVLYFVCIIIAAVTSLLFYALLAKYLPKVKKILSGNR